MQQDLREHDEQEETLTRVGGTTLSQMPRTAAPVTGHTPGPWDVEKSTHDVYLVTPIQERPDGQTVTRGASICKLQRISYTYAVTEANARLIAAAPDLLDALRAFCGDYESVPLQIPEIQAAYRHALTVIAKAEGR